MEFIPYIGPIIGPLPAVLVALFNDPISALWLILLFVGLQQLEGHVVAPQVFRISLRINPILIILVAADRLSALRDRRRARRAARRAVIRQTVVYLRRHLVLEPWAVAAPGSGRSCRWPQTDVRIAGRWPAETTRSAVRAARRSSLDVRTPG